VKRKIRNFIFKNTGGKERRRETGKKGKKEPGKIAYLMSYNL